MSRNTTSVRFPGELIDQLDRRAAALGLTRSELIIRAVEKALEGRSSWSPAFLKVIQTAEPELRDEVARMMRVIRKSRTRSRKPRL